ncbi:hypothetical protein ONS96_003422 [Cadophora gregata f. sp. sojae]|nr:hypothetical protein ONS96_003422 [Cadophora gregata f. sp. sojae]
MEHLSIYHAFFALACLGLFKLARRISNRRVFEKFKSLNECQGAIDISGSFPYGLDRINRIRNSRKSGEDFLDDILGGEFKNASTFQMTMVEGSCVLTTTEPANLQAMLATQFNNFDTGKMRHNQFWPVLGKSIFSSDGAFWEHSRALLRPQFVRGNINDLEETEKASDLFLKTIGAAGHDGWTSDVNLQPAVFNFTLDAATSFLFGESVESQAAYISAKNAERGGTKNATAAQEATSAIFLDAFATASDYTIYRLRLQSLYWLADGFKFRRAAKTLHNFTDRFVQRALIATAENNDQSTKPPNTRTNLLYALSTQTRDGEELCAQATAVLFAGRDTTAALICWCLLRLAQHPDIYDKLRKTVLTTFPPGESIGFAELKSCRSLQHFINEVLRLHPAIPFNTRVANKHAILPKGGGPKQDAPIAVYKGQTIAFSLYHMHRREDLWGKDAAEFKPERWEQKVPTWQFLPFSGGPRICIGQQYSLVETSFLIVKLLRSFDRMEPVGWTDASAVKRGMDLTMWPRDGVHMRLHRAASYCSGSLAFALAPADITRLCKTR